MSKKSLVERYADVSIELLEDYRERNYFVRKVFDYRIERIKHVVVIWRNGLLTYREAIQLVRDAVNRAMAYAEEFECVGGDDDA